MSLLTFRIIKTSFGATALFISCMSYAQENIEINNIGKQEFIKNCAVCHGSDGKGAGPILDFLSKKPADLTVISKNNGGVYPLASVYEKIRVPGTTKAHGTDEMPIWGERFSQEIIDSYGPVYTGSCSSVQGRILELVFYIGNIQE